MVVSILSRRQLLVGAVACLVAGGVIIVLWLAAVADGDFDAGIRLLLRNAGFPAVGVGMVLFGIRHYVRDPEPTADDPDDDHAGRRAT